MKLKFILIAIIAVLFCAEDAGAQSCRPGGGVTIRYVGGSQWKRPYRIVRQRMHRKHFHKNPYRDAYGRYYNGCGYREQSMGKTYYRRSCYH